MKLEVNITKKRFFAIFGAFLLLAGAIVVYAQGAAAPNPGHSADQIDFSGGFGIGTTNPRGEFEIKVPDVDATNGYPSIVFDISNNFHALF